MGLGNSQRDLAMTRILKTCAALSGALLLTACGGGGGGVTTSPSVSLQAAKNVLATPYSATADNTSLQNAAADAATTYSLQTDSAGKFAGVTVNSSGQKMTFDSTNVSQISVNGATLGLKNNSGSVALVSNPQDSSYQNYGAWAQSTSGTPGTLGVGSFGQTVASLPAKAPKATYSGNSTGWYVDTAGTLLGTTSNVKVDVTSNFSNVSITSSGTQTVDPGTLKLTNAPQLDFTGTGGPVSGNGFKITSLSGSGAGTVIASGSATGSFYGTAAQEVGGTFKAATGTNSTYVGAFGAK